MNLSIAHLQYALHRAAEILKTASGTDKFISQQDIKVKLATLDGTERAMIAALYEFLRKRESHPNGRTTWADLEQNLPFIQDRIVAQLQLLPGPIAEETRQRLSSLGQPSIQLAKSLKDYAYELAKPGPVELAKTLALLSNGLEPVGYHSGEYKPFAPVHLPGNIEILTPTTFSQIIRQHYLDFDYRLERLNPAGRAFFLGFAERQQNEHQARARELVSCMQNSLTDIQVAILEKERFGWHPTYIVGLTEGDVVGIWTNALWK